MPNTKIKEKPRGTIKKIEKNIVGLEKIKNHLITTKEKIHENTNRYENDSAENYAEGKVQNNINYAIRTGISKGNNLGKKSLEETKRNFAIGKQRIENFKKRIKEKQKVQIDNTNKAIKNGKTLTIKQAHSRTRLSSPKIKTTEKTAKESQKIINKNIKATQKITQISKKVANTTAKTIKNTLRATIKTTKTIIAGAKALTSVIIAGGWIAIVITLVIVIIAGFIASIYNSNGNNNYDTSQIPNSEIVLVAKAQIGNEGGDKFWSWYGFKEHVAWCACFVSWCGDQCGYINNGILPKFSACVDGINWFKEKNEWHDRGDSYYPIVGDIIFFDWKDEAGNQDGTSDHVGIVTRTDIENRNIYTIEGNTSNKCAERMYSFDDVQVMGYGSPKYE